LQCHTAHANWPSQIAIITDRAVYNAIQPVRRCASAINKKHATLNPEKDTLKRGESDDETSPTFPQEHEVDKYRGHITGTTGEGLGSSNAQPYFSSQVQTGRWTTEEEEEEQARFNLIIYFSVASRRSLFSHNPGEATFTRVARYFQQSYR
jgi:hypothetical protein